MRYAINYKQGDSRTPTMVALELFLEEHLIGKFHGAGLTSIFVEFIEDPPQTKTKFRKRLRYGEHAEVEIPIGKLQLFLNLEDFHVALGRIEEATRQAATLQLRHSGFSLAALLADLKAVRTRAPSTLRQLKHYIDHRDEIDRSNQVKLVRMEHEQRRLHPRPLKRALSGIRLYEAGNENFLKREHALVDELFGNLLRKARIMTPAYREIYVYLADNEKDAIAERLVETWHIATGARIDVAKYKQANSAKSFSILTESIIAALKTLIKIDHLDANAFETVFKTVRRNGMNVDLCYSQTSNKQFMAEILYNLTHRKTGGRVLHRLRLTELATKRSGIVDLGYLNLWWAPYSFGSLTIGREEVIVRARTSLRARVSLNQDKLPNKYRFKINDILSGTAPATRQRKAHR